jgi:MFS family permease
MFSPLRYRNYRFFWLGQFPSVTAMNMQYVAVAWLVFQLTNSPALLGITGLAQAVPNVAFSFVGGAVADRMDRQRLLLLTQGTTALLFFVLGTLVAAEIVQYWHVLVVAFLLGTVRSFDQPARQALLPLMVPREDIPKAVPLGNLVWQGTRLVGPATAGMLIYLIGVGHTYYVACACFAVAMVLFSQLRIDPVLPRGGPGLWRNILDGLIYIRQNDLVLTLIVLTFFNSVFGMSYTIMMPVFARDILHVGSQGFGFLETAGGVGSVLGTFGVGYYARAGRKGWQIIVGAAAFGVLLVGFASSSIYVLSLALLLLMGVANQWYMTTINTSIQMMLPNEYRGRVMGLWGLAWSLMPLGGTISGAIAEQAGAPFAIGLGATLVALLPLLAAIALPRLRNLD